MENLFVFTIGPPVAADNECHLAARTEEARTQWIQAIADATIQRFGVCNEETQNGT